MGAVNVNVVGEVTVTWNTPLKPAGVTFLISAVIGPVKVGSGPATVAVALVPLSVMLTIDAKGNCVGPLYGGSVLLSVPKMSGCVTVLLGH